METRVSMKTGEQTVRIGDCSPGRLELTLDNPGIVVVSVKVTLQAAGDEELTDVASDQFDWDFEVGRGSTRPVPEQSLILFDVPSAGVYYLSFKEIGENSPHEFSFPLTTYQP